MRAPALLVRGPRAIAILVAAVVTLLATGLGGCAASKPDAAVDHYVNQAFAPAHAKIVAARASYGKISAADIREPGKLEDLRFQIGQVSAPFLAQALTEVRALTPPASAKWFHDATLSVLEEEAAALADMAAALSPPSPTGFAAGHARMMNVQERVFRWEEHRDRLVKQAHIRLAPLPEVSRPSPAPPGAPAQGAPPHGTPPPGASPGAPPAVPAPAPAGSTAAPALAP